MEILTHEEAYRGKDTIEKIKKQWIVVCGCGAIGSNLIFNMVKQGFEKIAVIDDDRIEKHNIGTQMWGLREVNGKKVQIMQRMIHLATGVVIVPVDKKLTEKNIESIFKMSPPEDVIAVDGFDNFESRGIIKNFCESQKVDCVHIGLSEHYAEIVWNEKYKIPTKKNTGEDVCEYPLSRNISMLATTIGIESIIRYIATGKKISYSITMGDLKISELE